jgi:hypothetical protein
VKQRDIDRIEHDRRIDLQLATEAGKAELWQEFAARGARNSLIGLLESVIDLPGDVIECGVFRASSTWTIARVVGERAPDKTIHALDSYAGFPDDQLSDHDTTLFRSKARIARKFRHANDVPERIERVFAAFGIRGGPVVGYFADTLPSVQAERFCFVHIDSDTYGSHLECLTALYDRVTPGGVIVFDDYHQRKWPGATKAIDEFLRDRPEKPQLEQSRELPAWYIRKA